MLKQKIVDDKHLLPLDQIPYLRDFLHNISPKTQITTVKDLLKQAEANPLEQAKIAVLRLQLLCMQLAQNTGDHILLIRQIVKEASAYELSNDLAGFLKEQEVKRNLQVIDTDRAEDLLLCPDFRTKYP